LTINSLQAQSLRLLRTTTIPYYPSASAAEWYGGRLYIMGDDAPNLLVLRKKHNRADSILVFPHTGKRIHYTVKPDIEAAVLVQKDNRDYLLLTPSFSAPHRNKMAIVALSGDRKARVVESTAPRATVLKEINIEGAAAVGNELVFSNRGNLSAPQNHLLVAHFDTAKGITEWQQPIPFILPKTTHFAGVSGLYYVAEKDMLLFTASTEITASANADGEIGNSYLGIIKNFKQQLSGGKIVADTLLHLTPVLNSSTPQKIESIAVESIKRKRLKLHLVADNDNGESSVFRLRLKLPR
jgi:hypothetical protein